VIAWRQGVPLRVRASGLRSFGSSVGVRWRREAGARACSRESDAPRESGAAPTAAPIAARKHKSPSCPPSLSPAHQTPLCCCHIDRLIGRPSPSNTPPLCARAPLRAAPCSRDLVSNPPVLRRARARPRARRTDRPRPPKRAQLPPLYTTESSLGAAKRTDPSSERDKEERALPRSFDHLSCGRERARGSLLLSRPTRAPPPPLRPPAARARLASCQLGRDCCAGVLRGRARPFYQTTGRNPRTHTHSFPQAAISSERGPRDTRAHTQARSSSNSSSSDAAQVARRRRRNAGVGVGVGAARRRSSTPRRRAADDHDASPLIPTGLPRDGRR
jgi:hypothetical protein